MDTAIDIRHAETTDYLQIINQTDS